MLSFLKKLLGGSSPLTPVSPVSGPGRFDSEHAQSRDTGSAGGNASDRYFTTMTALQGAVSDRKYKRAADLAKENMRQVSAFVGATVREYGRWDIRSIPALEEGGTILALMGEQEALIEMRELVSSVRELQPWQEAVDGHFRDLEQFSAISEAVRKHPGCLQTSIKDLIGAEDGRRTATLIAWLEKAGRLVRRKKDRTYELFLPGAVDLPPRPPQRTVVSHRKDRVPVRCLEVNPDRLPVVLLPVAPLKWEENRAKPETPVAEEDFEIFEAPSWSIASVEKIPPAERPDPAYRQIHPTDDGLILLDDRGKAEEFEGAAAAIRFDRSGARAAAGPLLHDVYRMGVNPLGQGVIALSKKCVIHAYDAAISPILETALRGSPEVRALQERLGIYNRSLKNHLRSVALAHDASRYLVTGVDEAWCVSVEGHALWGLKLPFKEGWQRATDEATHTGTSSDVERALELMGLSFPITADEIRERYRGLALLWHPDRNPGNREATARMAALNDAAGLLRGIDPAVLGHRAPARFVQDVHREEGQTSKGTISLTMSFGGGETMAADWIYAAALGGSSSHKSFLAGYSGRIFETDNRGEPVRAYDIGAVPRRIADTDDYLYFLTDTRLYVLRDDRLYALVDTLDAGDLIMAQTGFGLLESKRFRWFREDGCCLGSILTKAPIRRVYFSNAGLTVETRQRRAVVSGAPGWWE